MIDPCRGIVAVLRAVQEAANETLEWMESDDGIEEMRRAYPVKTSASDLETPSAPR